VPERAGALPGSADPDAVEAALAELRPLGARLQPAGALGSLTTYRVGGAAAVLVTVVEEAELCLVAAALAASALPALVVGRGSNLLVADEGFGGVAVLLDAEGFGAVSIEGGSVIAGAAVALPTLARRCVEASLTGFEWAVGIPGSLGGSVRMNAGGHGGDMASVLRSCRVFDLHAGEASVVGLAGLSLGYRHSAIRPWEAVVGAELALAPGDRRSGQEALRQIVRWRRENQPGGQNAGSVFQNPPDCSAGWLVERAGQKGRRIGTAMVSPKHANFIQADPGGSADDVARLIEAVREEVERTHGVRLATEVQMIGFGEHHLNRRLNNGLNKGEVPNAGD
jgi:UDP-N-acetylmuramate dehydrogenase